MKISLCIISLLFSGLTLYGNELDSIKDNLNLEILKKPEYDARKLQRIETIKSLFGKAKEGSEDWYKLNATVGVEYEKYCYDSALFYLERNLEYAKNNKNSTVENESLLLIGYNLMNVGHSKEAEDILNQIDTAFLSASQRIKYIDVERRLYELSGYYASLSHSWWQYKVVYNEYKEQLAQFLAKDNSILLEIEEKDLLDDRKLEEGLQVNSERLKRVNIGDTEYSLITFQRSLIYELMGNEGERKKYLMLSATSDIRSSNKDNASLVTLAKILYEEGEIEEAYFYIQSAYEDALQFNSDLRFHEIAKILSPIAKSYQELADTQKRRLQKNFYLISALVIVLILAGLIVVIQLLKLNKAKDKLKESLVQLSVSNEELKQLYAKKEMLNKRLADSNIVKEHYIGSFLNIQASYIDKLDKYQKMVRKMLLGKKHDKLLEQINTGQFVDAEIKGFYKTFDEAFLSIYPNFIAEFNKLINEDEQIEIPKGELMTTEIRIFALIRLGIVDSSTIAKVLRYSVNTIYNYRVKLKNKSKGDRDEFENMVKNISAF